MNHHVPYLSRPARTPQALLLVIVLGVWLAGPASAQPATPPAAPPAAQPDEPADGQPDRPSANASGSRSSAAQGQRLDGIAAVVNDSIVLESELARELAFVEQRARSERQALPAAGILRERVLERLIDQQIQAQRARELGVGIDATQVNRQVERVAGSNNMDLPQFRAALGQQGIDYAQFRRNVEAEMLLARLVQRDVASRVNVSEQEIEDYLNARQNEAGERTRYRLQHILIAVGSAAPAAQVEQAREKAQALVEQLRGGAEFTALATAESDGARALEGGDLGWRERREIPRFLRDTLSLLEPGDISDPIQSADGWHVIRLADRQNDAQGEQSETLARHIFLGFEPGRDDASLADSLQAIRNQLLAGADFATLARENSEDPNSANNGGELPWFGAGQLPPELEQTADSLPLNTVSEPFRTRFGWHLLEVLERRTRDLSEQALADLAEQAIQDRKVNEETDRWIRQLRDETYVEIRS